MSKKVVLYTSSVAGNVFVNKNTTQIKTWLLAFKAPFTEVDCSTDDAARQFLQDNSKATNTRVLPQLFVDGKYLGDYAVLEELVEAGELKALVV